MESLWAVLAQPVVRAFVLGQASLAIFLISVFYLYCLRPTSKRLDKWAGKQLIYSEKNDFRVPSDAESCQWLNVLAQRLYLEVLRQGLQDKTVNLLLSALDDPSRPEILGATRITECVLGNVFPTLDYVESRCGSEGLAFVSKLHYNGQITLAVETELVLNWPLPAMAALPIELSVTLHELEAEIQCLFPSKMNGYATVSLVNEPFFDLEITSAFGETNKVYDLPKIHEILKERINKALCEALLLPGGVRLPMAFLAR